MCPQIYTRPSLVGRVGGCWRWLCPQIHARPSFLGRVGGCWTPGCVHKYTPGLALSVGLGVLDTRVCPQIHTRPSLVDGVGWWWGVGVGFWTPRCVHKYTSGLALSVGRVGWGRVCGGWGVDTKMCPQIHTRPSLVGRVDGWRWWGVGHQDVSTNTHQA